MSAEDKRVWGLIRQASHKKAASVTYGVFLREERNREPDGFHRF